MIERLSRIQTLITRAFRHAMAEDDRIIILGQDMRMPAGGAFKVTWGLSEAHSKKVLNMPISEAATMGVATGMSLGGMIPVVEVMFGDFLLLCSDQILNHATKFKWMYDLDRLPIIIRTPMGMNDGYGPTHSQSLEKYVYGMPGLQILALNNIDDPYRVYRDLLANADKPTLVIEHKRLYRERFDTAFDPPSDPDVTVWAYGWMACQVRQAMKKLPDIKVELICPLWLQPLDLMTELEDSVYKSDRLLIVEEGCGKGSIGSHVADLLLQIDRYIEYAYRHLSFDGHIPAAGESDAEITVEDIIRTIKEMV